MQRRGQPRITHDQICAIVGLVALALLTLMLKDASASVHIVVAVLALLSAVAVWCWDEITVAAGVRRDWLDRRSPFAAPLDQDPLTPPARAGWDLPHTTAEATASVVVPAMVVHPDRPKTPLADIEVAFDPVTMAPVHRGTPRAALHQD